MKSIGFPRLPAGVRSTEVKNPVFQSFASVLVPLLSHSSVFFPTMSLCLCSGEERCRLLKGSVSIVSLASFLYFWLWQWKFFGRIFCGLYILEEETVFRFSASSVQCYLHKLPVKGADPLTVYWRAGDCESKTQRAEDMQLWEQGGEAREAVLVQMDNMRPEGRAFRGCEMSWGSSTSGGIIRRWRSN